MRLTSIFVLCVLGSACAGDTSPAPADLVAAQQLVGTWNVRFNGQTLSPFRSADVPASQLAGTIALLPNHTVNGETLLEHPTNVGAFDADFSTFGFSPNAAGDVPSAVARTWGRDSVTLVLGLDETRSIVWMLGRWAGDSLVGQWSAISNRTKSAGGMFVMTKRP